MTNTTNTCVSPLAEVVSILKGKTIKISADGFIIPNAGTNLADGFTIAEARIIRKNANLNGLGDFLDRELKLTHMWYVSGTYIPGIDSVEDGTAVISESNIDNVNNVINLGCLYTDNLARHQAPIILEAPSGNKYTLYYAWTSIEHTPSMVMNGVKEGQQFIFRFNARLVGIDINYIDGTKSKISLNRDDIVNIDEKNLYNTFEMTVTAAQSKYRHANTGTFENVWARFN